MNTCIALFRGINVGGNNILRMKDLVLLLEKLGARNARTYIQSGNAIFQTGEKNRAKITRQLIGEIRERCGFEPQLIILPLDFLEKAVAENPFPEAESSPAHMHLGFLASLPKNPNIAKLDALSKETERYRLLGSVFYLHAPEGIGRSKLAAGAEKALGVPMTLRNWNTVRTLKEMAREMAE